MLTEYQILLSQNKTAKQVTKWNSKKQTEQIIYDEEQWKMNWKLQITRENKQCFCNGTDVDGTHS